VVHGDAVADGNSIHLEGDAPRAPDPVFYRLGNLGQVDMSGDNLGKAVDDADDGLINVGPSPAHGVQQGAVWGTLYTSFDGIAFHFSPSLADFLFIKKAVPCGRPLIPVETTHGSDYVSITRIEMTSSIFIVLIK
jgi:hypothetical protein